MWAAVYTSVLACLRCRALLLCEPDDRAATTALAAPHSSAWPLPTLRGAVWRSSMAVCTGAKLLNDADWRSPGRLAGLRLPLDRSCCLPS